MSVRHAIAIAAACALPALGAHAATGIQITEWMYNGLADGEFIEFSNFSATAIDFAALNFSFDDDSRTPGVVSLAAFGLVQPGESVVLTEADAASFRASWGLADSVKVIGSNTTNLGRADEINLFSGSTLVDRLTYGDTAIAGSIRTQNVGGRPGTLDVVGTNNVLGWVLASVADADGSRLSADGNLASPGYSGLAVGAVSAVPEPGTWALLAGGLAVVARRLRRAG